MEADFCSLDLILCKLPSLVVQAYIFTVYVDVVTGTCKGVPFLAVIDAYPSIR